MKLNMRSPLFFLALLAAAVLAQSGVSVQAVHDQPASHTSAVPSANAPYTVTDLGTLGGVTTKGMGINEDGHIAGASQIGSYLYGFLWDGNTMTNLGDLGGQGSWAYDVNDTGQVVGGSPLSGGNNHAFRWQTGSGMQDLGTLGGPVSYAFAISTSGQAVGYAWNDQGIQHTALWGNGGIVDLGDLDPSWPNHSAAYGINDAGQVVGNSYTADPLQSVHAFLWQNGSMQDLGTLGGDQSQAMAINKDGKVVGGSRFSGGTALHAFLWDGGMQDLGALTWNQSIAYDINDKGQVVGVLQTGQTTCLGGWADARPEQPD